MEANDMLTSLFSDPEKLQSAISMASSLFGGAGEAAPPSEPAAPPEPQDDAPPNMSSLPAMARPPAVSTGGEYDPSAELMNRAMPVLSAIARSGQNTISREKVHLLNAMKPFVATDIRSQLDHAMRLVSMARMARTVMGQLGGSSAATHHDGTQNL